MVSDSRPCAMELVLAALDRHGIRYELVSADSEPDE